jgi:hypothetical protein
MTTKEQYARVYSQVRDAHHRTRTAKALKSRLRLLRKLHGADVVKVAETQLRAKEFSHFRGWVNLRRENDWSWFKSQLGRKARQS